MSSTLSLGSSIAVKTGPDQVRLALVTAVHSDGRVDLAIFGPSATTYVRGVPSGEVVYEQSSVESLMEAAVLANSKAAEEAHKKEAAVQPATESLPEPESAA